MEWRPNWEGPRFSVGSESSFSSEVEDAVAGSAGGSPWPRSPPVGSAPIAGSFASRLSAGLDTSGGHDLGQSPRRRSTRLSSRNSTVWLAAAAIDMSEQSHSKTPAMSYVDLASVVRWPHKQMSLDKLPVEILAVILQYVSTGANAHINLLNVMCTCGRLYDVGVALLYRHIVFRYPHTFDKFRWSILATGYGQHVRVIDFSAFTSVGLGRTQKLNMEIEMVTSRTIVNALDQCPQIVEFLAGESIDTDMNSHVIDKLLGGLPVLAAIDFCGASHLVFVNAIRSSVALSTPNYELWNLTRVSLHSCTTIPSESLILLLGKLTNVHMLDLTHTQLTGAGLKAIPLTAPLTHLSIARCVRLDGKAIVDFFATHPATQKTLQWLSLMFDITRPNPLEPKQLTQVLNSLPDQALLHLNIYGNEPDMNSLLRFTNLESLSLAYAINLDIHSVRHIMRSLEKLQYINLMSTTVDAWTAQDIDFLNTNPNIMLYEFAVETMTAAQGVRIPGFLVDVGRGRRAWLHRVPAPPPDEVDAEPKPKPKPPRFTFARLARQRMEARELQLSPSPSPTNTPVRAEPTIPPMTDPIWRHAALKLNVSEVGPEVVGAEGIYNYYSFHTL